MPARIAYFSRSSRAHADSAKSKGKRSPLPKKTNVFSSVIIKSIPFFLLVAIAYGGWKTYEAWDYRLWRGGTRLTVVVAGENPTIYSYNPENASITQIVIPENTQLDASGGYGSWLAGSLWDLGVQEKKGGSLLSRSIQRSFGIPVDAWVAEGGEVLFADHKLGFLSAAFQVLGARNLRSNLTFFDKVNLMLATGQVGKLSRVNVDLAKKGVIKKTVLADETNGYIILSEKTSSELDSLRDDKVFTEAKTLKVTNSTSTSGLAAQVSRVASILGLRVISTDTTETKVLGACVVRAKESELSSVAAQKLTQTYGCTQEVGDPSGPTNVEIIIGKKFAEEF